MFTEVQTTHDDLTTLALQVIYLLLLYVWPVIPEISAAPLQVLWSPRNDTDHWKLYSRILCLWVVHLESLFTVSSCWCLWTRPHRELVIFVIVWCL